MELVGTYDLQKQYYQSKLNNSFGTQALPMLLFSCSTGVESHWNFMYSERIIISTAYP